MHTSVFEAGIISLLVDWLVRDGEETMEDIGNCANTVNCGWTTFGETSRKYQKSITNGLFATNDDCQIITFSCLMLNTYNSRDDWWIFSLFYATFSPKNMIATSPNMEQQTLLTRTTFSQWTSHNYCSALS